MKEREIKLIQKYYLFPRRWGLRAISFKVTNNSTSIACLLLYCPIILLKSGGKPIRKSIKICLLKWEFETLNNHQINSIWAISF